MTSLSAVPACRSTAARSLLDSESAIAKLATNVEMSTHMNGKTALPGLRIISLPGLNHGERKHIMSLAEA